MELKISAGWSLGPVALACAYHGLGGVVVTARSSGLYDMYETERERARRHVRRRVRVGWGVCGVCLVCVCSSLIILHTIVRRIPSQFIGGCAGGCVFSRCTESEKESNGGCIIQHSLKS